MPRTSLHATDLPGVGNILLHQPVVKTRREPAWKASNRSKTGTNMRCCLFLDEKPDSWATGPAKTGGRSAPRAPGTHTASSAPISSGHIPPYRPVLVGRRARQRARAFPRTLLPPGPAWAAAERATRTCARAPARGAPSRGHVSAQGRFI